LHAATRETLKRFLPIFVTEREHRNAPSSLQRPGESIALHSRALGILVGHSENGKLVVAITAAWDSFGEPGLKLV
jgi:hypothetical protein